MILARPHFHARRAVGAGGSAIAPKVPGRAMRAGTRNSGLFIRLGGKGGRNPCRSGIERQRVVSPFQGVFL
jgi:hypothetical protein